MCGCFKKYYRIKIGRNPLLPHILLVFTVSTQSHYTFRHKKMPAAINSSPTTTGTTSNHIIFFSHTTMRSIRFYSSACPIRQNCLFHFGLLRSCILRSEATIMSLRMVWQQSVLPVITLRRRKLPDELVTICQHRTLCQVHASPLRIRRSIDIIGSISHRQIR